MSILEASPNQREKQAQIIEAAKAVLLREGLGGCTARTLAEESSFSRSAIHYYFASMDEIVDAAMTSHLEGFVNDLRATAASVDAPAGRFWAVTDRYHLALGEQPELTMLWFDYSIAGSGRPEPAIAIEVALHETLADLLRECQVKDWKVRSEAVLAFMIGTTLRRVLHPGAPVRDIRAQLAGISSQVSAGSGCDRFRCPEFFERELMALAGGDPARRRGRLHQPRHPRSRGGPGRFMEQFATDVAPRLRELD